MSKQNPSLATPAIDDRGFFTPTWLRFFTDLFAPPQAIGAYVLTGSPDPILANVDGTVTISGGTVSSVQITRGNITLTLPGTSGLFPVSAGDVLTITHSVAPNVHFIPR